MGIHKYVKKDNCVIITTCMLIRKQYQKWQYIIAMLCFIIPSKDSNCFLSRFSCAQIFLFFFLIKTNAHQSPLVNLLKHLQQSEQLQPRFYLRVFNFRNKNVFYKKKVTIFFLTVTDLLFQGFQNSCGKDPLFYFIVFFLL
jgi:hypothetical protein